eukprot:2901355-Rhodomonas_salina.1
MTEGENFASLEYPLDMATPEVAGIGAVLKPNRFSILKVVDLHPEGAAARSGQFENATFENPSGARKPTCFMSSLRFWQAVMGFPLQVNTDDRLVSVDGVVVKGMTAQEVAPLIRGPVGSIVVLELLRPGATKVPCTAAHPSVIPGTDIASAGTRPPASRSSASPSSKQAQVSSATSARAV